MTFTSPVDPWLLIPHKMQPTLCQISTPCQIGSPLLARLARPAGVPKADTVAGQ